MARVEVVGHQLSVQIEGMDKLWSLKSRLEIPLAHVNGAEADPEAVRDWKGWRGPGTHDSSATPTELCRNTLEAVQPGR